MKADNTRHTTKNKPFQVNDLERLFIFAKAKWGTTMSKIWMRVAVTIHATRLGTKNSGTFF